MEHSFIKTAVASLLALLPVAATRAETNLHAEAGVSDWVFNDRVSATVAPGLNWVASRGTAGYSSTGPSVLPVGPRRRDESGLTLGAAGLTWAIGEQASFSLSCQSIDLDPRWSREAHVFSGALGRQF